MQLKKGGKERVEDQTKTKEVSSRRLKICHISDLHGKHEDVIVSECDVLICSGDISMLGQRKEVELFFEWFKKQPGRYKILVVGNHDLTFDPQRGGNNGDKPLWLIELIAEFELGDNWNTNFYLENDFCEIEGVKFWGSPTSSWFHGDRWAFNLRDGEDADKLYSSIPSRTDVVITHGPAYTYGDWVINCACYVGSHDLLYHIKRVKPLVHLFGHIHESYSYQYTCFGTHFFNGCNCGLDYEIHNEPWLIDADFDKKEIEILNKNQ